MPAIPSDLVAGAKHSDSQSYTGNVRIPRLFTYGMVFSKTLGKGLATSKTGGDSDKRQYMRGDGWWKGPGGGGGGGEGGLWWTGSELGHRES